MHNIYIYGHLRQDTFITVLSSEADFVALTGLRSCADSRRRTAGTDSCT